jgi:hypothetical protein
LYEPRDEWLEVGFANPAFSEHPLYGRANLGADLVAMRLGPVHFEVALIVWTTSCTRSQRNASSYTRAAFSAMAS